MTKFIFKSSHNSGGIIDKVNFYSFHFRSYNIYRISEIRTKIETCFDCHNLGVLKVGNFIFIFLFP